MRTTICSVIAALEWFYNTVPLTSILGPNLWIFRSVASEFSQLYICSFVCPYSIFPVNSLILAIISEVPGTIVCSLTDTVNYMVRAFVQGFLMLLMSKTVFLTLSSGLRIVWLLIKISSNCLCLSCFVIDLFEVWYSLGKVYSFGLIESNVASFALILGTHPQNIFC